MLLGLALMLSFGDPIFVQTSGVTEVAREFSYDAIEPKGRRKSPAVRTGGEDLLLDSAKRAKLDANAQDIVRNFAIASWMIRKHLDYVSSFRFHCRSGDVGLDEAVETFMTDWSRPFRCDAARRHRLPKMLRIAEGMRTISGDVGILKLANGAIQGIESDLIRNPPGQNHMTSGKYRWLHGVKVDAAGGAVAYALHRRRGMGGYEFARTVPAANLHLLGYHGRFDQVRGVSPLVSALNPLRDVYENFDYALVKAKVTQLFALAFYREADDAAGDVANDGEEGIEKNSYRVDFGKGPITLDLDPGDRAEFLESNHPSSEFQAFTQLVLMVALKSLDLPYSFYDEKHTNFFGSRAAWLHYERSCVTKREDLEELLVRLTLWRLSLAILDGELTLPRGKTLRDIPFEWVPTGMPWWDPAKEIRGDLMAIGAGLDNPQRITKERGRGDWYDNIDRIAEAQEYARQRGVALSFVPEAGPVEVTNSEQ